MLTFLLTASMMTGCADLRQTAESSDGWFDPGTDLFVTEPLAFTDEPYSFPEDTATGLAALAGAALPVTSGSIAYGADDQFADDTDCSSIVEESLPWELEGVVTLHPRFYFKTDGCDSSSDEKYYGSYFIQDATGGLFVLGDSKVAHFTAGTRVRMRVRGVRTAYDLDMVYAHDIIEVVESDVPIYYEVADGALGDADIGLVRRVSGTVISEQSTFGDFDIESDDGTTYSLSVDSDLNRRGFEFEIGTRIEATGPVIYSYSAYSIVIMQIGQVSVLD